MWISQGLWQQSCQVPEAVSWVNACARIRHDNPAFRHTDQLVVFAGPRIANHSRSSLVEEDFQGSRYLKQDKIWWVWEFNLDHEKLIFTMTTLVQRLKWLFSFESGGPKFCGVAANAKFLVHGLLVECISLALTGDGDGHQSSTPPALRMVMKQKPLGVMVHGVPE
jgi:hypothetical protein